ncbi:MAG: GAF domain-containing protein [Armatimonadetes bacterium]|nr:GAF domain-containing protein [Armatimonadota bacterium]
MPERYRAPLRDIEALVAGEGKPREKLAKVVETVRQVDPRHSWVGLYYLRGEVLELGPFSGIPTVHTRIPVGKGVCGTAVQTRQNQIVEDVRQCRNYLCCSEAVRSEIVVLIWRNHEILGVIDVDSDDVGTFGFTDEQELDKVAKLISPVVFEAV